MSTCSEAARNRDQAYNLKKGLSSTSGVATNKDKDLVYELIQQCCYDGDKMGEGFVRDVNFSKSIMTVLATDQQVQDLKRFCADPSAKEFSVLGIDPTFNLGEFCEPYEHKLLETHRTGKHPVFIGPIMVHLH